MKKVLLPLNVLKVTPDMVYPLHFFEEPFVKKASQYNLIPLIVSPGMSEAMIEEIYAMSDGAFLIGGTDFDPKWYQQERHAKTEVLEYERDILEIKLLKRIIADRKPFLGVCRGAQALAIASGGSLIQHIPDVVHNEFHGLGTLAGYDNLDGIKQILVKIKKKSKVYDILQTNRIYVSCSHHQAVIPGGDITAVGVTPAGIVEILEHVDPEYFCMGVQSHPETQDGNFFEKILQRFAQVLSEI